MTLSDVSIRHPVFAWMLMLGLMVFGAMGFRRMGISQLPDVHFPVLTVTVTWQGASPEVMESAVADIVEDKAGQSLLPRWESRRHQEALKEAMQRLGE